MLHCECGQYVQPCDLLCLLPSAELGCSMALHCCILCKGLHVDAFLNVPVGRSPNLHILKIMLPISVQCSAASYLSMYTMQSLYEHICRSKHSMWDLSESTLTHWQQTPSLHMCMHTCRVAYTHAAGDANLCSRVMSMPASRSTSSAGTSASGVVTALDALLPCFL